MLVMQFGIPVALKNIAWKTYIVFCVWCFIQSGILYFLVPETKNRTASPPASPRLRTSLTTLTARGTGPHLCVRQPSQDVQPEEDVRRRRKRQRHQRRRRCRRGQQRLIQDTPLDRTRLCNRYRMTKTAFSFYLTSRVSDWIDSRRIPARYIKHEL